MTKRNEWDSIGADMLYLCAHFAQQNEQTVDADTLLIKPPRKRAKAMHIYWIAFELLKLHCLQEKKALNYLFVFVHMVWLAKVFMYECWLRGKIQKTSKPSSRQ